MQKYLIPFSFINVEDPHQFTSIENQPAKQEDSETSSSEQSLHAPSETYISPASSYDCLSFLTSYPEIKKFQPLYDSEGINFPYFGTSPGPTPTESSESEIEIENKDHVEDVYDPVIWKSEVALDAAQQVTLASNVYKAVNLMKPQVPGLEIVEGPVEDERPSSRFANARIDARAMMKAAVSAVIAVNKFSKSAPTTPRKTRVRSAAAIRAKKKRKESVNSLTAQRRRSVTVDDVDEESSYQVSTATSPAVTTVGFAGKEVPFGKSVSIPSKQGQVKGQRAVVTATKSARLTKAKNQGDSLKTRKKAQGSKSASSFQQDSVKQIKKKIRSSSQAGPRLQSVPEFVKKPLHETSAGSGSGIGVAGGGGGITQVQMTYKRPELFKNEEKSKQVEVDETSKETSLDQKKSEESPQKPACNADPGADLKSTKDFLQRFLQSPRPNTTMSGRGDKIAEKDKRPITRGRTKSGDHVKSYHDDENDDPDRSKADVLDYDLHAIYKKDGLRFDECWQERMLERYQLMKLQREQRHYAAASKRTMLEHDRKYKILSHKPELMYHDTFAWYEDHARFAEHVMNSPLLTGDADRVETTDGFVAKQLDGPVSAISTNRSNLAPPAARPPSIAETLLRSASRQDLATPQSEKPDLTKKYRFSFRRTSDGDQSSTVESPARPSTAESRGIVTPMPSPVPAATPISVANLRQASSAKSMRKFLVERPRSSTSIPGKTRYVLIKSDPPHFTKTTRTPSPTKLEEDLLKQRFPSQHHQLMRSLGRLESSEDKWYSDTKSSDDDDQQSRSARYSAVSPRRSGTFETTPRSLVSGDSTNGRSWRRPSIRESAPAVLQARDPSLISVLHRKSSNYVPAAFKV
uniref:Uncharacterized protein LOC100177725 n=1 Tax=Phallusia mammillata TaxID=59560 RepID=A0A6F9DGS1_9ASCI|nr:uncharacterized protein LOC100177725 [Phallusia mammillata]